jgi:hypothetical protein
MECTPGPTVIPLARTRKKTATKSNKKNDKISVQEANVMNIALSKDLSLTTMTFQTANSWLRSVTPLQQ